MVFSSLKPTHLGFLRMTFLRMTPSSRVPGQDHLDALMSPNNMHTAIHIKGFVADNLT